MAVALVPFSWERVMNAHDKVRARLALATQALADSGVRYAVAGGNAVQHHVARADETQIRGTRDVDILIDRADFEAVKRSLESKGFRYRHVAGIDVFLDGAESKVGDAVHILYAGEKVRDHELAANPGVDEIEQTEDFRVLALEPLVRIKLTAYRRKDQVHLQDMIRVGLIDPSWVSRFTPELGHRLQILLDDPDG